MIPEQTLLGFPLFGDNATKVEPDNNKKSNGWQQGDVVPAEWMNWEWYHASKGVADLNKGVSSMEKEINAVLASFGITPAELTNNQLLTAMRLNASFVTADSTTITGPLLVSGGTIRVMFTQDITGSDTTTGLTVNYNGATKAVKVNKDGVLTALTAHEITTNVFKYIQKYTPLELYYDGVDTFIVMGNPLVLSGTDYKIYADGKTTKYTPLQKTYSITANQSWSTNTLNFNEFIDDGNYRVDVYINNYNQTECLVRDSNASEVYLVRRYEIWNQAWEFSFSIFTNHNYVSLAGYAASGITLNAMLVITKLS